MWEKIKSFFSKLWSKMKPFMKYIVGFLVVMISLLFLGKKKRKSTSDEFSEKQKARNKEAEEANKIIEESSQKANDIIEDYYNKKRERGGY